MAEAALLALTKVRVGRARGQVYVFDHRLELVTDDGERTIPITDVERVAQRRSWRGARLLLTLTGGQIIEVRRLSPADTAVAHRMILALARAAR